MRTKTETRRQAILEAASAVFQELGFERSSMAAICERVGYSKATLYSYFDSKEDLFSAVIFEATESEFQAVLEALDPQVKDLAQALEQFGERWLKLLYSPQVQAVRRLVVAEAGRSALGRRCYELGPVRTEAVVSEFLAQAMADGRLRRADARIAALQLKALLEAEWIEPFLFQTLDAVSPADLRKSAKRAVAVFMTAYGLER
ncbi:MAG: TetR/AcrR family transcriptional regulator C-terminal domain-containing protein [Limnohabitans sp.]